MCNCTDRGKCKCLLVANKVRFIENDRACMSSNSVYTVIREYGDCFCVDCGNGDHDKIFGCGFYKSSFIVVEYRVL